MEGWLRRQGTAGQPIASQTLGRSRAQWLGGSGRTYLGILGEGWVLLSRGGLDGRQLNVLSLGAAGS